MIRQQPVQKERTNSILAHPVTTEDTNDKPTQTDMEVILSGIVYCLLEVVMKGIIEGIKLLFSWAASR